MLNKEKREVVIGDNDIKMACTSNGIMFGYTDIPDNEEDIESSYEFGIIMSMDDIINFHKRLTELTNKQEENLELTIFDTTFKFRTHASLDSFMSEILQWAASVVYNAIDLAEYLKSVCNNENK